MPVINFAKPHDTTKVSAYSKQVLADIMKAAGVSQITITSTTRTAQDQAHIMVENLERHGVAHQKRLYGQPGDSVIDHYTNLKSKGVSRTEIISGLTSKISSIGPQRVSGHAGDPAKINVIDIAPSSINRALWRRFEAAVTADRRVSKLLVPPKDPAYHLEIPQPSK